MLRCVRQSWLRSGGLLALSEVEGSAVCAVPTFLVGKAGLFVFGVYCNAGVFSPQLSLLPSPKTGESRATV